jgi:hypothetical protein
VGARVPAGLVAGANVTEGPPHCPHSIGHTDANDTQNVLVLTVEHVAVSGSVHSAALPVGAPNGGGDMVGSIVLGGAFVDAVVGEVVA